MQSHFQYRKANTGFINRHSYANRNRAVMLERKEQKAKHKQACMEAGKATRSYRMVGRVFDLCKKIDIAPGAYLVFFYMVVMSKKVPFTDDQTEKMFDLVKAE